MVEEATSPPQSLTPAASETDPAHAHARPEPRPRLIGGLVIKTETLVNWARWLKGRRPDSFMDGGNAYLAVWPKVQSFGGILQPIGEEAEEDEWMVVTQVRAFNGWKGMDQALVPEFVEGEEGGVA